MKQSERTILKGKIDLNALSFGTVVTFIWELILTRTNFGEFGKFKQISAKLVLAKIKYFAHSPKKFLPKLNFIVIFQNNPHFLSKMLKIRENQEDLLSHLPK